MMCELAIIAALILPNIPTETMTSVEYAPGKFGLAARTYSDDERAEMAVKKAKAICDAVEKVKQGAK